MKLYCLDHARHERSQGDTRPCWVSNTTSTEEIVLAFHVDPSGSFRIHHQRPTLDNSPRHLAGRYKTSHCQTRLRFDLDRQRLRLVAHQLMPVARRKNLPESPGTSLSNFCGE